MALYENLNLRREETIPVLLLVLQSIFLGFFLGAFDVGANTLFLNSFGKTMIPRALIISGITGIILTSVYSYLQSRLRFSSLAVLNLLTVFILTFLLRAGYYYSDTKWLAFALFVLMGPLNIIALVGFWGTAGRLFDLRQGKRVFGFIDTGQVVGVIVSSMSIPFLITMGMETKNLLYISAISIFLALMFQFIIVSKYPVQLDSKIAVDTIKNSFTDTLKIPYVRAMSVFVIISMLVAFFVHYLFLSVADERFNSPQELAKFFGWLIGTLTFVSVLIKTFVYGTLMKTYGLRVSLLISPAVMLIVTVSAALVGSIFGYSMESATFTFFFLLISLSKFFQKSLKDSIEGPVIKILYQSLPASIRHEVQARVDGTINETAALVSGIILAILGLFSFIALIHYSFILIGFILIWFIVSVRLYQGYRRMLRETLETASLKRSGLLHHNEWIERIQKLSLRDQLEISELSKPWLIPEIISENISNISEEDAAFVCYFIRERPYLSAISVLEQALKYNLNEKTKAVIQDTVGFLKELKKGAKDEESIKSLLESKDVENRIKAAKLIGFSLNSEMKQQLTFLMRDLVGKVKKQAIWAAHGSKSVEVISFLIDFLDKDEFAPLAHAAMINSGDLGIEQLQMAFGKIGATEKFLKRIIRIIPDTGSNASKSVLLGNLSVKSSLKPDILDGLLRLDFITDEKENILVNQLVIEQAAVCAWNLNIMYQSPPESKAAGLKAEMEFEFYTSREDLFKLLKLQYDRSSIDIVMENLKAGTGESIAYALELMDNFIAEELKPYLFPLLESTTISNKIWSLQNYFPLRVYSQEDLLNAIINRNENLLGKQAKIYALNAFNFHDLADVSEDLAAQLFNSDKILSQISAQLVNNISNSKYVSLRKRMNDRLRVELDRGMEMTVLSERTTMERLSFFKSLQRSKAHSAPLYWLYNASSIRLPGLDLFQIGIFKGKEHILLIETGSLQLLKSNYLIKQVVPGEFFRTRESESSDYSLVASEGTLIHFIDLNKFLSELYDFEYLTDFLNDTSTKA